MKEETPKEIKRILVLADFACATGFANVAQNVVKQLLLEEDFLYQVDVVGINYHGMPSEWQGLFPRVRIFPAQLVANGDLFGRVGFLKLLASGVYDYAWVLQDTFNIEPIGENIKSLQRDLIANGKKPFRWAFYYPIDAEPKENWIKKSVSLADAPVAYTQYGYNETVKLDPSLSGKLKVIPHGTDLSTFNYIEDRAAVAEFRKTYFKGLADNRFLVINVNRNQPRKDLARSLQVFKMLRQRVPEAMLYLHCKVNDVAYNIEEVARLYGMSKGIDFIVPENFNEHDGVSFEIMNYIYNSADCLMTTTLGEGWGLSLTEAMATKCPVVAPNNTSITEILADGRGLLVRSGAGTTDWIVLSNDNERIRPLTNIADMVEKLVWVRDNQGKPELTSMVEKAYKYVTEELNWDKVGAMWRGVIKSLEIKPTQKIGRNDPCYCGSGKKFKNCCLSITA